ncbi:hypothetical protein [Symmachiella dynata]|uniref:hypothetical protein n=1 Tax=Symmachiella dynata TaxID=2527995 RepID=UPI0030EE1FED|tara:strand:- start:147 stop:890 length:744 start_codon:yes stop_codon:yes gene_type:complete
MDSKQLWDAVEREDRKREEMIAKKEEEIHKAKEWNAAWIIDRAEDPVPQLSRLGNVLQSRGCGFWLDYFEISIAREFFVTSHNLRIGFVVDDEIHPMNCLALKILKLAFLEKSDILDEEIRLAESKKDGLERLYARLGGIHDSLKRWCCDEVVPATPFMTGTEFAEAMTIPGFRLPSDITKKISTGEITVYDKCDRELGRDGRNLYRRFLHKDNRFQLKILRQIVPYLKKTKTHDFLTGPKWTAGTD